MRKVNTFKCGLHISSATCEHRAEIDFCQDIIPICTEYDEGNCCEYGEWMGIAIMSEPFGRQELEANRRDHESRSL